jgi:predicted polyphosphate/ATP-dependent NAD kinase
VSSEPRVGIVANPASGRDVRRLVAGASVFGNADKAGMVLRLLTGLAAAGVPRALMMPAADGLGSTLERQLRAHAGDVAALELLPLQLSGTVDDTLRAVAAMCDAGVAAIVVLGGDGTHRAVAKACAGVPLCALSTGTNNAFGELRETTVAGIAVGLAVTGRGGPDALRREYALAVEREAGATDFALVDVALTSERFVGARALWRGDALRELVVTLADPAAVGLSSIAGLLAPLERGSGRGLYVSFAAAADEADIVLHVPLAPGLVAPVAIAAYRPVEPGDEVVLGPDGGCLALDGEREIELRAGERARVTLVPGPYRIDVDAVMRHAARSRATCLHPARI